MEKELARWLQVEKVAVEEAYQGRDAATLEVAMKATCLLKHGQLEGIGVCPRQVHPKVAGLSHTSAAVAVQPPVVVT